MKIICSSQDGLRRVSFSVNMWWHVLMPAMVVALTLTILSWNPMAVTPMLADMPEAAPVSSTQASNIMDGLVRHLDTLEHIKDNHADYSLDIDTLSRRLGVLEAEIARLNALAKRVAGKANLDAKEFALDSSPPRGGVDFDYEPFPLNNNDQDLLAALQHIETSAVKQENVLNGLDRLLEGQALAEQVNPSAQPTASGYISSRYGFRRDPFNGRAKKHSGIDFAGPSGTPIFAVGGGVVSFAARKGGYGNVLEVDHGDGMISRYAHLKEFVVEVGAVVKKGDKVALMGSTGRSTGPHLHLEIIKNGKKIDPLTYLQVE